MGSTNKTYALFGIGQAAENATQLSQFAQEVDTGTARKTFAKTIAKFNRTKSGIGTVPFQIWIVGDSISEGAGLTNALTARYSAVIQKMLSRHAKSLGPGMIHPMLKVTGAATKLIDTDTSAGWQTVAGAGFGGWQRLTTTNAAYATYTFTGTSVKVFYVKSPTGGAMDVKVDNVSIGTISQNGAVAPAVDTFTVAGNGAHVLKLTCTIAGGQSCNILGICTAYAGNGVITHNLAVSSTLTSTWGTEACMLTLEAMATEFGAPDLVIYLLGGNDATYYPENIELFKTRTNMILSRFITNDWPVLAFAQGWGDETYEGFTGINEIYADHMDALGAICDNLGISFINMFPRWKAGHDFVQATYTASALNIDERHPNAAGHLDIANAIAEREPFASMLAVTPVSAPRVIANTTLAAAAMSIPIDKDMEGNAFSLNRARVSVYSPATAANQVYYVLLNDIGTATYYDPTGSTTVASAACVIGKADSKFSRSDFECEVIAGNVHITGKEMHSTSANAMVVVQITALLLSGSITAINKINITLAASTFSAGTTVLIEGWDA